jgi:glycolate oxidase FAD binding subunit
VTGLFRFEGVEIAGLLEPRSPQELAAALAAVAARGGAVLVRGGGSRLAIGNALRRADAVLETAGLARLLELDAEEGVLQAEAGVPLATLRAAAAAAGWELPLDPPGAASTLGGALASAAPGPSFSSPRDTVLGIEVALSSGDLVHAGGRVVKNVTGYDLCKLFTGSFGALGVITSAWLRLRPQPEARALLAAPPPGEPALALEAARRPAVRAALWLDAGLAEDVVTLAGGGAGGVMLLELAGDEPAVEGDRAWLAERVGAEPAEGVALDRARERLGAESPAPAARAAEIRIRVATVPTAVAPAAAALRAAGAAVVAQPARGLVHARAALAPDAGPEDAAPLLAAARAAAERGRGSWRIEAAPLAVKRGLDVFGDPGPRTELLRRLKAEYDPHAVLNPGRFAGGL